jgi:hypothetical protein
VPALEFADWDRENTEPPQHTLPERSSPFSNQQEYRFCRAVVNSPMQPSSTYPKIAGISPKSAKAIREQLIAKGFIREHRLDPGQRGRSALLLEPLPAGQNAVNQHQPQ